MNEHGNIEIWEGRQDFVPKGAAYIEALKSAKLLELPCVPAVIGFERKGGHNVPIIGGVVVLQQHAAILRDAAFFVEAVKEESAFVKRDKIITARWEKLTFGIVSRQKLRAKYGH